MWNKLHIALKMLKKKFLKIQKIISNKDYHLIEKKKHNIYLFIY